MFGRRWRRPPARSPILCCTGHSNGWGQGYTRGGGSRAEDHLHPVLGPNSWRAAGGQLQVGVADGSQLVRHTALSCDGVVGGLLVLPPERGGQLHHH